MFNEQGIVEYIRDTIFRLKEKIYEKVCDLEIIAYKTKEPVSFERKTVGEKVELRAGDKWGDLFDCAWFHMTGAVPVFEGYKKLVYVIDINGEGLIYDQVGCPYRGITNINSRFDRKYGNPGKRIVPFRENTYGGETVDFWMDAGCNDLFGILRENGTVKEAFVASCNDKARELFYDMTVLLIELENISNDEPLRYELIHTLKSVCSILHHFTEEEYNNCSAILKKQLAKQGGDSAFSFLATGHAHIDLAWLWPLRETRRKGARTFATALELMSRYPGYIYGAGQPQLYEWIKQDHPALYHKIKEKVAEKRWELQGAMWVESDTNVTSGESLIRQIQYGNQFWEKEFGQKSNYVWLPDVFGYSAALPQIIKKSGIDYFSTIKISWNLHNKFPYMNFKWKGLDGSEVLAHMPPEGAYLSEATPKSLVDSKKEMARCGQFGEALLPFGIGDGGGGPSPCHLEYLKREENLHGLAPVRQGFISDFFDRLSKADVSYPVWEGELYLECHQGTYTSQSKSKKYNRKLENLLRETEMLSSFAMKVCGYTYPQEKLKVIWKELLLYQFHDILPGSSIMRVYDESHIRYEILMKDTLELREKAALALAQKIDTSSFKKPCVLFNTLSFTKTEWIKTENGFLKVEVPPLGYQVVDLVTGIEVPSVGETCLENEILSVEFGDNGSIQSVYNKKLKKELLSSDSNLLCFYDDPGDSWDFNYEYRSKKPDQAELIESRFEKRGPTKKVFQTYRYKNSLFNLVISLTDGSERLEFFLDADWHECDTMFRIQFRPKVKTTSIDCEIQFGHITRSCLENNNYEKAQIEICAHKWIEMDENDFGFALLNDCKYGYYAKNGCIEMNVLRGSCYPADSIDEGKHSFKYAIFANKGERGHKATIQQGYDFNVDLIKLETDAHNGQLPESLSFVNVKNDQVIVETIKKAEEDQALIIRSYESCGGETSAEFVFNMDINEVYLCNLTEKIEEKITENVTYKPFEIQSLKII